MSSLSNILDISCAFERYAQNTDLDADLEKEKRLGRYYERPIDPQLVADPQLELPFEQRYPSYLSYLNEQALGPLEEKKFPELRFPRVK